MRRDNSKNLGEKERLGERIAAIQNTVARYAENLGLQPIYEAKSGKESFMDKVLDICNRVYEIATNDMRRCVSQSRVQCEETT